MIFHCVTNMAQVEWGGGRAVRAKNGGRNLGGKSAERQCTLWRRTEMAALRRVHGVPRGGGGDTT